MVVVNASNPASPTVVTQTAGAPYALNPVGVTMNPTTNRFYSSDGYNGRIVVYDGSTHSASRRWA